MEHAMKGLWYYAHRFRDKDPVKQAKNLERALERFEKACSASGERRLWAPWLDMASSGVDEYEAWLVIDKCIRISAGIVLDLDGDDELSPGMSLEQLIAEAVGAQVEV